jgi:hypothetical protein
LHTAGPHAATPPLQTLSLFHSCIIQTLKPGKFSLTLDASRIIQGTQQTDFPPDATTTFSQQLALSANEAWEKPSASALGTPQISKFQPNPPLTTPPLSTKQPDQSAPIIPTKGWNVRSLAFLGQVEGPEASTETRPPIYDRLFLPACFSACKTTQELPVTQLARHVNLFHLVITDNQIPETLSLPHGLDPPIKPTTQFSQATSL